MISIEEIAQELYDAGPEQIEAAVWKYGSLPVRSAMLGIATSKKKDSPFYYGYPPGIFISYKWDGEPMWQYVDTLAGYLRKRGYKVFLDVHELGSDADNYTDVPAFIASLRECVFYLLLLTEKCADIIDVRNNKTTWLYDEYQQALRVQDHGKLLLLPLLLEEKGETDFFKRGICVDLTKDRYNFEKLDEFFPLDPISLDVEDLAVFEKCLRDFDSIFLQEKFPEALAVLLNNLQFSNTFDHRFRLFLHSMYTANEAVMNGALKRMDEHLPPSSIAHLYSKYCEIHGIPNQLVK
jgi:TIR domain